MRSLTSRIEGRSRSGSVLLIAVMITAIIGIIAGAVLRGAVVQRTLTDRYQLYTEELAIAEFQLNKAFGEISYALQRGGETSPENVVDLVGPAQIPGYEALQFDVSLLSDKMNDVSSGSYAGYTLRQLNYRARARVRRTDARGSIYDHPGVALQEDMEITYVPLSIFGIFSDVDLELHPGANFKEKGRIHSNANFYYGSDGYTFDVEDRVTVAKDLIYGRHPNSGKGLGEGTNRFWDTLQKKLVSAKSDGWVDSSFNVNGKKFAQKAKDLWSAGVADGSSGAANLSLPWPRDVDGYTVEASEYIQPKKATDSGPLLQHKFAYKAGLHITRTSGGSTVATNAAGGTVTLPTGSSTNPISTGSFYNEREGKTVSTLDIDLGRLKNAGVVPAANGMVYVENNAANGAVRLHNGKDLPGSESVGFSVATPNTLYVKGDYNSQTPTLSMLAADAVYILSKDFADADNTQSKRGGTIKAATETVTNAVIGAGNVPTQIKGSTKEYSGGVENFFRYMENWSGKKHTFNGSIMLMFKSRTATGFWSAQKYNAPNRDWHWDEALKTKSPPGAPVVFVVRRANWKLGG